MGRSPNRDPSDRDFSKRSISDKEEFRCGLLRGGLFRLGLLRCGTPERRHAFAHSRSWRWLPPAAVAAFVVLFLVRRFGGDLTTGDALLKAVVFTAGFCFLWAVGVWAATGEHPRSAAGEPDAEPEKDAMLEALPLWVSRIVVIVILLLVLAAVCAPQIAGMVGGEVTLGGGFGYILLKFVSMAAVLIPLWLDLRNR